MTRSAFAVVCAIALSFVLAPSFNAAVYADPPTKSKKQQKRKKKKKKKAVRKAKPAPKQQVDALEGGAEEDQASVLGPMVPSLPGDEETAAPPASRTGAPPRGAAPAGRASVRSRPVGRTDAAPPASSVPATELEGEVAGSATAVGATSTVDSTDTGNAKSLSVQPSTVSPGAVSATAPTAEVAKPAAGSEFDVGFDRGFFIRSADKKYRIQFGLESRVQASIFQRKTPDRERVDPPSEGAIRPRSMQLLASGTAFERYGFVLAFGLGLDPDRPLDSSQMTLAFATAVVRPWLTFRSGLFVVPFGIEGSNYFFASRTIERSITAEALAPGRDSGVAMMGDIANGRLFYSVAVIGGSGVARIEPEDQPDGVFRLQAQPIMKHLKVGASAQVGTQPFNLIGGRVFATTRAQRDVLFDSPTQGLRQRYGADISVNYGPLAVNSEAIYERSRREKLLNESGQIIEDGEFDASRLERMGGHVEAGLFVLGDNTKGLELVGKYERLAAQTKGPPNELQPIELNAYTAGLNWYLQPTVLLQVNGMMWDLERMPTPELPGEVPLTYLDNKARYLGLAQFQFWFF